jgi:mannose-6-phosphate isomerase-like protein (cupin superfamily)
MMVGPIVNSHNEEGEYLFREGCYILESWNREEDPDVSIARARLASQEVTIPHSLVDTNERYFILEGKGEVSLGQDVSRLVGPGDVVFIPAGCRQSIRNKAEGDLTFLAICSPRFDPDCYRDESS